MVVAAGIEVIVGTSVAVVMAVVMAVAEGLGV